MSETTTATTPSVLNVDIGQDIGVFNKDLMTYSVSKQTDYAVLPTFIALLEYKLQPRPIAQDVTVKNSYKDAKVQVTDASTDKSSSIDTYIYEFLDTWKDAVVAVYEQEKDYDQKETLLKILELIQKDGDASKSLKEALDSVQSDLKPSDQAAANADAANADAANADAANADAANKELDAVKEELSKANLTQTLSNILSILKDSLKAKVDEELYTIISNIEQTLKPKELSDDIVAESDVELYTSPATKLGSLSDAVKKLADNNKQLTQELAELKANLETNSTQLTELSQANNGANEESIKLKEELATTNTGMETANAKITKLKAQLTSAHSVLSTVNDKATNLESQITTKDEELATKVSELTALGEQLAAKDTEITELNTQLQFERDSVRNLRQELNGLNAQLSQVQADQTKTDELQKTVDELQNKNTELTNSLKEINVAMNLKGASIDDVKEKVRLLKIDAEMYKTSITSAKYALDQLKVQLSGNNKLNTQVKDILYKYSDSAGRPHDNPMVELTKLLDINQIKASQESIQPGGGSDEYRNKQMKDMMNRTNIKLTDSQFVTATRVFVSFVLLAFSVFATQSAMVRYSQIQQLNAKLGSKAAVFTLVLGCLYPALLSTYALATRSFRTFGMLVATSIAFAISLYISGSVLKSVDTAGAQSPSKK